MKVSSLLAKVFEMIQKMADEEYTGSIQINFFRGGVTNINKVESIKL